VLGRVLVAELAPRPDIVARVARVRPELVGLETGKTYRVI
jgi:hypothetical protein